MLDLPFPRIEFAGYSTEMDYIDLSDYENILVLMLRRKVFCSIILESISCINSEKLCVKQSSDP